MARVQGIAAQSKAQAAVGTVKTPSRGVEWHNPCASSQLHQVQPRQAERPAPGSDDPAQSQERGRPEG